MKLLINTMFIGILLSSCATIVSKKEYPVNFSSSPAGCKVAVKRPDGSLVHQGTTPTTVTLPASAGFFQPAKYDVTFTTKRGQSKTIQFRSDIDGWYFGNLVFGGLIGMVIVDPATGAMWKLDPDVHADFTSMAVIDNGNGHKLYVAARSSVPDEYVKHLVAIH